LGSYRKDKKVNFFETQCILQKFISVSNSKKFSKSVNNWWSYCEKFDTTLFWNTVYTCIVYS